MVVLNGADGVNDMLAKALTMGGTGLGLARQLLASMNRVPDAGSGSGSGSETADGAHPAVDNHVPNSPIEIR